jgi:hypothetical protein
MPCTASSGSFCPPKLIDATFFLRDSAKQINGLMPAGMTPMFGHLFMAQYRLGAIPHGEAPTWRQMTTEKVKVFAKGCEYFKQRGDSGTVEQRW